MSLPRAGTQARSAPVRQLPGRAGEDDRLLCAASGGGGDKGRGGGLAETAGAFAGAGGVEQGAESAARPRGRQAMKRWFVGLALAGLGVCLFLVWGFLETRRGPNQPPCRLAEEGRSVGVWARPALASPVLRRLSTGKRVPLLP